MTDISQLLSDHYDDPYHRGECEGATHAATCQSQPSGCQIALELRLSADGQVHQAWFDAAGCELCEAVASILAMTCEGKSAEELKQWNQGNFFDRLGLEDLALPRSAACLWLPFETLGKTLRSPVDCIDSEVDEGPNFGGPSLREEC